MYGQDRETIGYAVDPDTLKRMAQTELRQDRVGSTNAAQVGSEQRVERIDVQFQRAENGWIASITDISSWDPRIPVPKHFIAPTFGYCARAVMDHLNSRSI